MPSGGAGRHWKPTRSAGNDTPLCACGDGLTARRSLAGTPLCRRHVRLCLETVGPHPEPQAVAGWVEIHRAPTLAQ